MNSAKAYIQLYLQQIHTWTKDNNRMRNQDNTSCTLYTITPDPAENNTNKQHNTTHEHIPKNIRSHT